MAEVPFVDLKARVASVRAEIDAAVARVIDSGWFILGPEVEAFERELADAAEARNAVAVANGTQALQLSLWALGLGPGDEVVTTSLSAAFTTLAIVSVGARPIFVDIDPETLNLDPGAVAHAVTPRTRAILPVHLYGRPADMDPIVACARQHGIVVVEDACQAHGARYKSRTAGTLGSCGALSFYPTKNLGALGDGGAILTGDASLAERLRRLRNGGQADRYRHEEPGINSRLDELQAAVLRVGLKHLPAWTARRRHLADFYRRELEGSGVALPVDHEGVEPAHHLFVIRHPRRDALMSALRERRIGTLIHYPIPLHRQPAFASSGDPAPSLPAVEKAAGEILSLPLYPELTDSQAEVVVAAVRDAVRQL